MSGVLSSDDGDAIDQETKKQVGEDVRRFVRKDVKRAVQDVVKDAVKDAVRGAVEEAEQEQRSGGSGRKLFGTLILLGVGIAVGYFLASRS